MNSRKNKILLLSDLKGSSKNTLSSTISLAKKIDADIDVFHVMSPVDVVNTENALSAIGDLNRAELKIERQIKQLIAPYINDHKIEISHNYAIGSVKRAIKNEIKHKRPDIIVLGKRQSGVIPVMGNNVTDFVLQNFDGNVLISCNDNISQPSYPIFAGYLNDCRDRCQLDEVLSLISDPTQPIKTFKIVSNKQQDISKSTEQKPNQVDFVFEKNEHILDKLSDYVKKNNINLLFVEKSKNLLGEVSKNLNSEFKDLMRKMNVSLFVLGGTEKTV